MAKKSPPLPVVRLVDDHHQRGPWVYARRVAEPDGPTERGALVEVLDASDRFVGHALWNGRSDVRLRWLSRGRRNDMDRPAVFLEGLLRRADKLRRKTLRLEQHTDAYRIAHAEGDDLPGLIVDRLGPALVVEHHALGFWRLREEIERALGQLYPSAAVYHRIPASAGRAEQFEPRDLRLAEQGAATEEVVVTEHGLRYPVLPGGGHKTGFFCDQRDSRARIGALSPGRRVLDLCTNSGGFALSAARAGARSVRAVDLDEAVLPRARGAAALNDLEGAIEWIHADAYPHLRAEAQANRSYDLVVCDPPKLIANRNQIEAGSKKYLDLNALALAVVQPGGLIATFSCSGALDQATFLGLVFAAARRAGRELRVLEILGPGPDHPQRPDFPRSRYLKGALVAVD